MEEQVEKMKTNATQWSRAQGPPSKYDGLRMRGPAGIGAAMAAELMIGFWFGIGIILAVKMVQILEYCIEELISRKQCYCQ